MPSVQRLADFTNVRDRVVSVYNTPGQNSGTHFEALDNIHTNSLGLSSIPRLLEYSQYPPEITPIYRIRRDLIEFISEWQFYNANNMDLNQIRTAEPKIGGSDIYLSSPGDNFSLILDNLTQQDIDFEGKYQQDVLENTPNTL